MEEPRRRHPRFQIELGITLESASHFWKGRTTNLSEGGVFVATTELKPIGTEVELTITLPDQRPVWVRGVVRWIRDTPLGNTTPLGMGIQFKLISDASLAKVRWFLTQRPALHFDEPKGPQRF
ncbi:MAG TPA: TIGR02266 family protein [Polyangiaceae bacterium]|nr:TIGR02266 family protein [Polyangiaceae bacterium]